MESPSSKCYHEIARGLVSFMWGAKQVRKRSPIFHIREILTKRELVDNKGWREDSVYWLASPYPTLKLHFPKSLRFPCFWPIDLPGRVDRNEDTSLSTKRKVFPSWFPTIASTPPPESCYYTNWELVLNCLGGRIGVWSRATSKIRIQRDIFILATIMLCRLRSLLQLNTMGL